MKFIPILDQYCTITPTLDQYEFLILVDKIDKFKNSYIVPGSHKSQVGFWFDFCEIERQEEALMSEEVCIQLVRLLLFS